MCQYFSKTEVQISQVIKQRSKEAFENNMYFHKTMKTIVQAYLSNRKCSVQKAAYNILSELKFRRIFSTLYSGNTNLPEEKGFNYYFLKKNVPNYQTIAQAFSRD